MSTKLLISSFVTTTTTAAAAATTTTSTTTTTITKYYNTREFIQRFHRLEAQIPTNNANTHSQINGI